MFRRAARLFAYYLSLAAAMAAELLRPSPAEIRKRRIDGYDRAIAHASRLGQTRRAEDLRAARAAYVRETSS